MSPGCPVPKSHLAVPSLQVSRLDRVVTMLSVCLIGASSFLFCMIIAWLGNPRPSGQGISPPPQFERILTSGEEALPPQPGAIEAPDEIDESSPPNEQVFSFLPADQLFEAGLAIPTALMFDSMPEEPGRPHSGFPTEVEGNGNSPIVGGKRRVTRTWQIELGCDNLADYQRQLGQLGIDVSAQSTDGTVATLRFDADGKVTVSRQTLEQAADDMRFAMSEGRDTPLGRANEALFQQAGIDLQGAEFVHHLSGDAEQQLDRLEQEAAGQNDVRNILRTEFSVRPADGRYEFFVTEQIIR